MVDLVDVVPVDLRERFVVLPEPGVVFGLLCGVTVVVEVVRGEVTVVSGVGVVGFVVLESRTVVIVVNACNGGIYGGGALLVEPVEHHGGVVGFGDTSGAFFALIPAPVGVVEVVVHQVVYLLVGAGGGGALSGAAPSGEHQLVVGVEVLLDGEEQAAGVVERAFDYTFFGVTADAAHGDCPTFGVEARGVGEHAAEHVVGVGEGERTVVTGGVEVGGGVIVHSAADVAEAVVVGSQTNAGGLVAKCARGHAHQRGEVETTANHVVHLHTVDVNGLILRVIAAIAEVHRAEVVRGSVVVHVVVGTGERGDGLGVVVFVFEDGFIEDEVVVVAEEVRFRRRVDADLA